MSVLWDNYAKTTAHLSMIEHGAYRLLLDHYMQTGSKLKANEEQLLRVCRAFAKDEKQALLSVLGQFFELRDGHYFHADAEEALAKRAQLAEVRRKAGAIGGAKSKPKRPANAKQLLPTSLPSSLSQKEERPRERAGATKSPAPLAAPAGIAELASLTEHQPDWADEHPIWAKVKASMSVRDWALWFAPSRPNGSPTTLICVSRFTRDTIEEKFGEKLEAAFGERLTFKIEDQKAKPKGVQQ